MFELINHWVLWLLPLPLLIYFVFPRTQTIINQKKLKIPFAQDLLQAGVATTQQPQRSWLILPALVAWSLLIIAAARPQWIGDAVEIPTKGRDLMLAVDLSGSMRKQDMIINGQRLNRLLTVQALASEFIKRRQGDRIGLILFGDQAYLQAPLTFDLTTVSTLLNEAQIGLAGRLTAIGDAIGLAVKRLQNRPEEDRVLILMTDGANTAGEIEPLRAAELAERKKVKIYTIGIGGEATFFDQGDLDEPTLKAIAKKTHGQYFRARSPRELQHIYQEIEKLEPIEQDVQLFRPKKSLYYWFLLGAMILASLIYLYSGHRKACF